MVHTEVSWYKIMIYWFCKDDPLLIVKAPPQLWPYNLQPTTAYALLLSLLLL